MARKDIASVGQIKSNTTWDNDLLVSAVGTVMLGLLGSSKSAGSQYVMVFDSASAVSNGTAPKIHPIFIGSEDNFYIEIPVRGMEFLNGIYIANSSTDTTLTIGSADCWFTAVMI
jgi:hypothetical protein